MAFGDTIQAVPNDGTSVGSLAVNFAAAVAGNLLIAAFARSAVVSGWTDPGTWTPLTSIPVSTGNLSAKWYFKIAAGGETTVTGTTVETSGNFRGAVAELEGPFEASPLDVTAENEDNIAAGTTSQASGTTAATAQNDEVAVAFFAADQASNIDGGRAYSNSFTEVIFASATVQTGRCAVVLAKKVLVASAAQSTTYSTSDPGDEMYGAIATFKKLAVAGGDLLLRLQGEGLFVGMVAWLVTVVP